MRKVYLERRYVNYTFESTKLDLNDLDLFIRSELQRYDIYESSTSSLRNNAIIPPEKQAVNNSIEDACPAYISDNTKIEQSVDIPRYHSSISTKTSLIRSPPPGGLSYQILARDTSKQETWNTSATSALCSGMENDSLNTQNSLSGAISQPSMASTAIKQSDINSIFLTVVSKDLFFFRFNFRTESIFLWILWML